MSQDNLMDFTTQIETCQQSNENFSSQFLSMPDLDDETTEQKSDIELLAEFNINSDIEQDIVKRSEASNEGYSLNCVLPSVNNQIDDGATPEVIQFILILNNIYFIHDITSHITNYLFFFYRRMA